MKPGVGSGLRFGALAPNHLAIIHPFFEVRTPFVALAYRLGPYSRVYDFTYISPNMYLSSTLPPGMDTWLCRSVSATEVHLYASL